MQVQSLRLASCVMCLGMALTVVTGCAATKAGADYPLVRSYLSAVPVVPTWNPSIQGQPMWSREIALNGVSVTVSAQCCVGQRFVARYSDEPAPRTVYNPGDYVYPAEMRVSPSGHVIFGRASGLAGGLWQVTKIFAYDLDQRRLVEVVEVDPNVLPLALEPASPRPH